MIGRYSRRKKLDYRSVYRQFYKLQLHHEGTDLNGREIYTQLSRIVTAAETDSLGAPSVGVLTSRDRSKWAQSRMKLIEGNSV